MKEKQLGLIMYALGMLTHIDDVDQPIDEGSFTDNYLSLRQTSENLQSLVDEARDVLEHLQQRAGELYDLSENICWNSKPLRQSQVMGIDEEGNEYDIEPVTTMRDLQ